MKYRLTSKTLASITKDERKRLNYLTLRPSAWDGGFSMMRTDVLRRKRSLQNVQVILIRDASGTIIGWSSVIRRSTIAAIYTYVMRAHRRKGLGSRLISRALQWSKEQGLTPRVFAWDFVSESFFDKTAREAEVIPT